MKQILKWIIMIFPKSLLYLAKSYSKLLSDLLGIDFSYQIFSKTLFEFEKRNQLVTHKNTNGIDISLKLYTPNAMCKMRADTFSTKEPEVLRWIDNYGSDASFWDIGANIGLYSIYYALSMPGKVFAFEPSVFNLKQLTKNITVNEISTKININPIPLANSTGYGEFLVSSFEEGSAQNAFSVGYGFDGNKLSEKVNYNLLGMTGDEMFTKGYIKDVPRMIKLDVDGIEHLILEGMKEILKDKNCFSIFVEVNDDFEKQSTGVKEILTECGFLLSEKAHAEMFNNSSKYSSTFNQIWFKS